MKFIAILFTFLITHLAYSQFVTYKNDTNFIYSVAGGTELFSIIYKSNSDSPVFKMQYSSDNNYSDSKFIDFNYTFDNKICSLQARVHNKKYLLMSSCQTFSPKIQIDNFKKTDDLFTIGKYTCNLYKAQVGDTKEYMALYTTNLNDGIDYNIPMQELQQVFSVKIPVLEKGEIVIEGGMLFENNTYWEIINYVKKETIDQEFVLEQNDLLDIYTTLVLNQKSKIVDKDHKLTPSFCLVQSHDDNDKLVDEKISDFLDDMCVYFENFGYSNYSNFCNDFDMEIESLSKKYKKYEILNTTQVVQFNKIAKEYSIDIRKKGIK
ncbi:hypothetical protein [Flavobacterium sp.]|uniref:hypothetical protein n=1 Tax=Flavobacterium sp. TaxID=239 RepID=UPI00286D6FAB|nr:hypothetical protein [Flavobacterium sp.]